uniref:Uncharacterized protein n=1 Tax=Stegastes partitus TaxID=144197 RepID=A0A3B5A4I5_9TELE
NLSNPDWHFSCQSVTVACLKLPLDFWTYESNMKLSDYGISRRVWCRPKPALNLKHGAANALWCCFAASGTGQALEDNMRPSVAGPDT